MLTFDMQIDDESSIFYSYKHSRIVEYGTNKIRLKYIYSPVDGSLVFVLLRIFFCVLSTPFYFA